MNRKDRRAAGKQGKGGPLFAPPAPASSYSANLFASAVAHFRAGRLDQAERDCRALIAHDPNHADALHLLGMVAFQAAHRDAALAFIGRAVELNPRNPDSHVNLAQVLRSLGRIDDAARHLAQACALARGHAVAHANLAEILMQQGKPEEARPRYEHAVAIDPKLLPAQHALALIAMQQGRFDDAVAQFRRVLTLAPDFAEARSNFGVALAAQGNRDEAIAQYRRALELKPELIDVYRNLGRLELAAGNTGEALILSRQALGVQETSETRGFFVHCVAHLPLEGLDALSNEARDDLRRILARALSEGWTRPSEISAPAARLIRSLEPAGSCIARAASAWPERLPAHELWAGEALSAMAGEPLLGALLKSSPVLDLALERFLTMARAALLEMATASDPVPGMTDEASNFFCALARQCFINEYVFAQSDDETRQAVHLRDALAAALASGAAIPVLQLAAVAAYVPLHTLTGAPALLDRSWPAPVAGLLDQQVREPLAEQQIRPAIRKLTPIEDETSLAVQRQYEDMPYPRWVKAEPVGRPIPLDWYMRNQFPRAPIEPLGPCDPLEVLIAGTGTGMHAIESAQRFGGARVLAIDLSGASLAYAMRRTRELGLSNIEYAQADILNLGELGQKRFDLIEAAGVLHHLRDPSQGWHVLLALLRPGGLMRIGLYSAIARADVRAARTMIAERGYASTAEGIRQCRQEILALADGTPVKNVTRYPDFFTTSECRDLLFHVQEHQFTIPQIADFLRANGLTFIGFTGALAAMQAYQVRFPADAAMTDLAQWHQLETEQPMLFTGMYQFVVQKPA